MHIVQRGNNRQPCFFADEDRRCYLDWLEDYALREGCRIHAYVLMTNHVHILLSPDRPDSVGAMMKALGQRYVQHVNRAYQRSGTLWEGRYRSCLVQDDRYLLNCMRYIELNPVRAGMVDHPGAYRWSSYHTNAQGGHDRRVSPHAQYLALGADERLRAGRYRELFRHDLDPGAIDQIRTATNGDYALGDSRFAAEIASALNRRTTPGRRGRPPKGKDVESTGLFD
ncbi:MAG TPA: transposase [Azoarcus taiwanensis]|nr:transposase [Azoarcus taiwanensis]